jgi:L-lactate dehydrogenase complex protein LldF
MTGTSPPHGQQLLDPQLPYDMGPRADRAGADVRLQQFVNDATLRKDRERVQAFQAALGARYDQARALAGQIRQHTLDHLDVYLDRFVDRATAAGATIHFATDAAQAREICLNIARRHDCRLCVKSKSMVTEEIHLVPAMQEAGIETIETDLGEFIIQLDDDAPSHIVTPMIHKDRVSVAEAFQRELGAGYTEDPERLTMIAREYLRQKYRQADLGISGANFLVAETGTVVLCTNEGNADMAVHGPPVHVVVTGIEKVIPLRRHLPVFLKLLARSSTAQPLTVYTTLLTGPRRDHEHDGPSEMHIVLVDNGRTELLAPESRELLRCIRCGACLNACPVYRKVGGGHAYGAVYSGPIGAVITPLFKGLANYPDLPQASSLCGACHQACPVDIDIPNHLVRLRRELVERRLTPWVDRVLYRLWARSMRRPLTYRLASAMLPLSLRLMGRVPERGDPHGDRAWIARLPGPLRGWTSQRDLPTPTSASFRRWWCQRNQERAS